MGVRPSRSDAVRRSRRLRMPARTEDLRRAHHSNRAQSRLKTIPRQAGDLANSWGGGTTIFVFAILHVSKPLGILAFGGVI